MAEEERNPNRIDQDHYQGIIEYLGENVPNANHIDMIEFMFDNWAIVNDKNTMVEQSRQRQLEGLRRERDRQDEERAALDAEIIRLEGR